MATKYKYIELIKIATGEIVERIDTSNLTMKKHLKALNDIQFNDTSFKIDESLSNQSLNIVEDETSVIRKYLNANK